MRSDPANLPGAQSVTHQRGCGFGRVTLALMLWSHSISNFHDALRCRRSFETALTDYVAAGPMHQHKAMNPRISRTRAVKECKPGWWNFGPFVRLHLLKLRANLFARLGNQLQVLCLDGCRVHRPLAEQLQVQLPGTVFNSSANAFRCSANCCGEKSGRD